MALAVCLHSNIYDENAEKRVRGEAFEASEEWIAQIIAGDAEAGRDARISQVDMPKAKRGRPKKDDGDASE